MKRLSEGGVFALFEAGYEDRLAEPKPFAQLVGLVADKGFELAFAALEAPPKKVPSEVHPSSGLHVLGAPEVRAATLRFLTALEAEGAEHMASIGFRPRADKFDGDAVNEIYQTMNEAEYCRMFGYQTDWYELADGTRFVYVRADAESG